MKPSVILPQTVNFHNQTLLTLQKDGIAYVAMKPICENIGLDWEAQRQRINRDEVLSEGAFIIQAPTKGGIQKLLCLPIHYLNGWLFGVDVSRVKAEIKQKLITYKKECYQALFDYWNNGVAVNPRAIKINDTQAYQIQKAIKQKCQHNSVHYQTIYHALYDEFGVKSYKDILAVDFDEALVFIQRFRLQDDIHYQIMLAHIQANQQAIIALKEAECLLDWALGKVQNILSVNEALAKSSSTRNFQLS